MSGNVKHDSGHIPEESCFFLEFSPLCSIPGLSSQTPAVASHLWTTPSTFVHGESKLRLHPYESGSCSTITVTDC